MQALKWRRWPGLFLCCSLAGTVSCGSKSRPEKWIIPENYAGWLRLDLCHHRSTIAADGRGCLPRSNATERTFGDFLPIKPSIDRNEFFVATGHGLQKLEFSEERMAHSQPAIEEYAVQNAFGFFKFGSGSVQRPGKCIFVGTNQAFRDSGRDCRSWESGQSAPPKFEKHIVLHESTDGSKD